MLTAQYVLDDVSPQIDIDPDHINPGHPPPDQFRDDPYPGGTIISIEGLEYTAGMSKRYVTPPAGLLQLFSTFTYSYWIKPSETAALYSQVHEDDLRIVGPDGKVYIGDAQKNNQEGGMWMVADGKGGWVDTGFKPGLFVGGVWTKVSRIYTLDWKAETLALTNITDGTQTKALNAVLPAAPLNWTPGIMGVQNQEGLNALGGAYTCNRRAITIAMQ